MAQTLRKERRQALLKAHLEPTPGSHLVVEAQRQTSCKKGTCSGPLGCFELCWVLWWALMEICWLWRRRNPPHRAFPLYIQEVLPESDELLVQFGCF